MLKTTCPFCDSTNVRRSSHQRGESEREHGVHYRYRCRDCGRSFQGGGRIAIYVGVATAVIAIVIVAGSLGLHALDESAAEARRVAEAAQVSELIERARREDPAAEYELYHRYARGLDAPDPSFGAQELLQRSAEHGNADAQYELASALREGVGVVQDYARALKWMQSAAKGGNWQAHYSLGLMYRDGVGTAPDPVKAYIHLNVAAARGFPDAAALRNAVMAQLTPEQVLAAQAEARALAETRTPQGDRIGPAASR